MAKSRDIPDLQASDPLRLAAAKVIEVRTRELFDEAHDVLDMTDIERVHDMRVASRRLRAVLEIFAPCFPKAEHRSVLREVKQLADALGERRDPDVAIEGLTGFAERVGHSERPGVEHLIERFRSQQATGNEQLRAALSATVESDLHGRLGALAAGAREQQQREQAERAAAEREEMPGPAASAAQSLDGAGEPSNGR